MGTQENVIYGLATTSAIVFGTLTLVFSSTFFGIAFGAVVSASAGYLFQSRSWKRTVKRENALKNNDLLYSPLYKEVGTILDRCAGFSYQTRYSEVTSPDWNRIKAEPQYRFIEPPLQGQ